MLRVVFIAHDGHTQEAQAQPGDSVMQAGLDHGVTGILADCGGSCACATCHCYVDEAWLHSFAPAAAVEAELASFAFDPQPNSRLACQLVLGAQHDGLVVRLPRRQI